MSTSDSPLHARLASIFATPSRSSIDTNDDDDDDRNRDTYNDRKTRHAAAAASRSTLPHREFSSNKPPTSSPIVRWLSSRPSTPPKHHSRAQSKPPSPVFEYTPPSATLASLNDALSSPLPNLPNKPPNAHLPQAFYPSRGLSHSPPFFDNLTRSTLPTASISPPPSHHDDLTTHFDVHSHSHDSSVGLTDSNPPIYLYRTSPRGRSSIDTLRSVRDRGIHTTAVPQVAPISKFNWWWSQEESNANVDSLLREEDRAETIPQEQEHIRSKYKSPKNPIVFCHGLLGFDSVTIGPAIAPVQVTHWRGIKEVLEANGCEVLITRVPATSSPRDRAMILLKAIEEHYPSRSVHLIGHSMGGLDCRYLTTHLKYRTFRVLSVTTIATPHRGSSFASHFIDTIGGPSRLPSVLAVLDLLPNGGGDGKAFECLTVEAMRKFNEETPDVEVVRYFSWGANYDPGLIDTWKWPHSVILEKEGPNDGLVSVASSKWGTYLGTLQEVNHLDLVGWINPARYMWAGMWGKEINFKPATFYLSVADFLAREVEGMKDEDEEAGGRDGREAAGRSGRPNAQREDGKSAEDEARNDEARNEELGPTIQSHPEASALLKGEEITLKTRDTDRAGERRRR